VDARGLQARPAVSPEILDEKGTVVYGLMMAERGRAVSQGVTGYPRDLSAAGSRLRVMNNPLRVNGLKTEGSGAVDVVVNNADAQKIRAANNLLLLKKGRVFILLGEED